MLARTSSNTVTETRCNNDRIGLESVTTMRHAYEDVKEPRHCQPQITTHLESRLCLGHTSTQSYLSDGRASCRFRSEEHTSELQSRGHILCRLLLEKK